MRQIVIFCSQLDAPEIAVGGILLAAVLEIVTVWFRFGHGLTASEHTAGFGRITGGLRVHHGYVGVLTGVVALGTSPWFEALANALVVLSIGLLVSDFVHHFLVLWPITGSHEFHLTYRRDD